MKSHFRVKERNKGSSLGKRRDIKGTVDFKNQYEHTKLRWAHRRTTYQTAIIAMLSSLACSCMLKRIIAAATMCTNATVQLVRRNIRTRGVLAVSFAEMFD